MNMPDNSSMASDAVEDAVAEVVDAFQERVRRGERPDVEAYAQRYPHLADILRRVLPALEVLRPNAESLPSLNGAEDVPAVLGDFRIIRQVGKGGMGIVYEAEQISLRRRVALKVLPLAATMDPRHLQRFHNEAQAAACLHHTNIVPVHSVGCERSVHFYAMQFIDGQPLSEIIRQLQHAEKKTPTVEAEGTVAYQPSGVESAATPPPASELTPLTGKGRRSRDYYRKVAELGIQAAEALDHAHQVGIVHRDIKPGNLMLDIRGILWVTDFGLAHIQHGEASLTGTGQMVGTPRYMSPEQALAKRVPIDHRTDVYSLGVTLYELLTLRPAFTTEDRQELLRQIASEEPVKPRRLERAIPAELEIIVLKAMEKRPQDRYATAQEMADDLRRWLLDQPIRARRPSRLQVARKWMRRHQAAVRAAGVLLVALLAFGFVFSLWWVRQQAAAEADAASALQDAERAQQNERWSEALSAIRRAQAALRGFGSDANLRQHVDELAKDLEMVKRLEEARLQFRAVEDGHFDYKACISSCAEAFVWYGLDMEHGDISEAAEFIRSRSILNQLVAGLDQWASLQRAGKGRDWEHLLAVARAADIDDWRNRLRDAWEGDDGKAMNDLLASAEVEKLLPTTLSLLIYSSSKHTKIIGKRLEALLRQVQQRHPDDFWINQNLASMLLYKAHPPKLEEAIGFYRAAVVLRPQSPGALLNFGNALRQKGQLDEAIAVYREANRIKENYAAPHNGFGIALAKTGRLDEAIAEFREAIRLKYNFTEAHSCLGIALAEKGQLNAAIAEHREAVRINKEYAAGHHNLGDALRDKGQLDEAIEEYRESIRLENNFAEAHSGLGNALWDKGQLDAALAEHREAIRLKKDLPSAHTNLGNVLHDKGRLDEAIAEHREAIRINKDFAFAHLNLGAALREKGQLAEAIAEYREAIRLKKDLAKAHSNLGSALATDGQLDEAIAECREAIRIKKDDAAAHNHFGAALRKKGRLDEAIAEYREAIRLKKDFADPHNNLGVALKEKGRLAEAIAEYREAIRLKKDSAAAHSNLGLALKDKGQLDEAIAECREATRLKNNFAEAHNNLGWALLDKGQLDEAIVECREAIRLKKDYAEPHNNLGHALGEKGRLDDASAEFREAIRLKKDLAAAHYNLGNVLYRKLRLEEAIAEFGEAIRLKKDDAVFHYGLGLALLNHGKFRQAVEELRCSHELGSRKPGWRFPSAELLRKAETFADLESRLPALLKGREHPKDARDRIALAEVCQLLKKHIDASVRWYSEAFADEPQLADDLNADHRYNAACAAALAGCGQGKDADKLDAKERARLRQQALDWLRADLKAYRNLLEKDAGTTGPMIAQTMQHWLQDNDFAGVRGDKALAKLPEAERSTWKRLWADVAKLLAKAQGKAPAENKPDAK